MRGGPVWDCLPSFHKDAFLHPGRATLASYHLGVGWGGLAGEFDQNTGATALPCNQH